MTFSRVTFPPGESHTDNHIMPVINEFTTEFNQLKALNHHRKIISKSQQILGNFRFIHFFLFILDAVVRRASSFLAEVFFWHGY